MHLMRYLQSFQDSAFFPLIAGLLFLFLTHLVCLRFFKKYPASPVSGSVIMVLALYVAECLPSYHLKLWLLRLLMVEVAVIWVYGSFGLLSDFFLKESTSRQSERFGLSAWIAATSLLVVMVNRIAPLQHGMILLLVIFAWALWLKYIVVLSSALSVHIKKMLKEYVSASLLLGAASTAGIVWMSNIVFQGILPSVVNQSLILLACLLYAVVFLMWLSHYFRGKKQRLLASWGAENSLIFGSTAMIGMAGLIVQSSNWLIDVLWFWSVIWALVIAVIDISHACVSLAIRGLGRKLLAYDVKHWLRIFSYCMLFVFTSNYYASHYSDHLFAVLISEHGLNVVGIMVLLQIIYSCVAMWLTINDESSHIE